jgi:acyl-coenzyme A synthetase/AMP-(fatty) acid ligase
VVLEVTREFQPTILFGVPTNYHQLLATSPTAWEEADLSSLRLCVSAGEPLGGHLLERWRERTGLEILDGLGMTDVCNTFISNRAGDVRPDCTGTVVEGYDAKVVDDDGREVAQGERGVLMVKGDSICAGYWHQHELTKQALVGEWLRTSDTFVRDEAGYFYYQGRTDDMLKVGGMWVSPREIEEVLDQHDQVVESAVVGVRDAEGLVRPEAFVVLTDSGNEQQLEGALRHHVRQRLGGNKTPRTFYFVGKLPAVAPDARPTKAEAVTLVAATAEDSEATRRSAPAT